MTLSKGGRELAPGILQRAPAGQQIQIHGERGWPLPVASASLGAAHGSPRLQSRSLGRKAVCGLEGGPWQPEGGVEKRALRSTSVYAPNALLLTLPNPGTECSVGKAVADGLVPRSLLPSPQACFFRCLLRTQRRCQIVLSSAQAVPCLVQYQGAAHWAVGASPAFSR